MEVLHVERGYCEVNNRASFVGRLQRFIDRYLHFWMLRDEILPIKRSIRREFWQLNIVMEMLSCS